jgi:superfamily II DNA or RNA helicase
MSELWPHQVQGIQETLDLMLAGERRIVLTSPTGGGKTRMMLELIEATAKLGMGALLLTHRKLLFEQLAGILEKEGVAYGPRASGYEPRLLETVQLAMVQSELVAIRKGKRDLHDCGLVLIDEAHVNASPSIAEMAKKYEDKGATVVWVTATPLALGHVADHLVVAGTTPELQEHGCLVRSKTFGPDEPDMTGYNTNAKTGDYSEQDAAKAMMTRTIFGRVYDHWKELNPDALPALLFAPDVAGSIYFCEQFWSRGVPCAHIDGEKVWLKGKMYDTSPQLRAEILNMSLLREIRLLSNRFVLREGIDCPWLYHGILATPFGSLQSYIQSGGRLLRSYPGLDHVLIQDHGGNWWRHGSLNQARTWDISQTAYQVRREREERLREKPDPEKDLEPIHCPRCHAIRLWGKKCQECGYESLRRSRMVMQASGTLREREGEIFQPRTRCSERSPLLAKWISCYYRCRKSGRTFAQAEGLFHYENYAWPNREWPLMPKDTFHWGRLVQDVPKSELIQEKQELV